MRLLEHHRIDRYDPRWVAIDAATLASKVLDNAVHYLTRQIYIKNHTILSYGELDKLLQPTSECQALPAKVARA
jgi:putative transposase